MKTLKITAKDIKKSDSYWSDYIGKEDVSNYDGHIEIEGGLGYVRFPGYIRATGRICAEAGSGIKAGSGIEAGEGIEAGSGIEAGWGIKAGSGIEAGEGIEAGWGIKAGLIISCKLSLNISYRIFAGLALWKKEVTDEEKTITCGKLENGEVCYGILKEIGMPGEEKEATNPKEITIDGAVYILKS